MAFGKVSCVLVTITCVCFAACGDEGTTPDCPPMPLLAQSANDASQAGAAGAEADGGDDALAAWFADASARGCATQPGIPSRSLDELPNDR